MQRQNFRAPGPSSAHAFMLLWEAMFQKLLPDRLERQQKRADYLVSRVLWRNSALQRSDLERCLELGYEKYPDSLWLRLLAESYRQLAFPVHAALWAPYVDQRGMLPESDIGAHILARVPKEALEQRWGSAKQELFVSIAEGRSFRFNGPNLLLTSTQPTWVERDRDDLVHCADGPARVWEDGSATYAWRGTLAPVAWFPQPSLSWVEARTGMPALLPRQSPYALPSAREALQTANVELRRVAIEMVGWDSILNNLRAVVVDKDPDPQVGTLVRVRIPPPSEWFNAPSEEHMFLRVQCGTGRSFALPVPPEMKTARQANAWTYGLEPEEYAPEVRT